MNMFSNMKIGARLGFGFALVLALAALMTGIGVWRLREVATATSQMAEFTNKERLSHEWIRGISTNAARTIAVAKSGDLEVRKQFQDKITAQSAQISKAQDQLKGLMANEEERQLLSVVAAKRESYVGIRNNIFKMQADGGDPSAIKQDIDGKLIPALDAYEQSVQDVVQLQQRLADGAKTTVDSLGASGSQQLIALGLAVLAIGALLARIISRSITRPLRDAAAVARTVASGDLSSRIEVKSKDEAGQLIQAIKEMNDSLLKIVGQVRRGTDSIATASVQIASGNLDLSSRTEQQASSLEETASSMEELTSIVKQNAENAMQANRLAVAASDTAVNGGEVVAQVVSTMSSINDSSKKIVDIIGVIDSIAFQTNILALNAAVEAARAGEQGRGFAVVASEVRNLAQRSAAAAKEIKGLIGDSVEKVAVGSQLVEQAGSTMDKVVSSIKRVTDIVGEIATASQEQSAGIEQVNQAITQMEQVTQQNAALVEEAAAATESLQDQASELSGLVSTFKLSANDTHRSTPAHALPAAKAQATKNSPSKRAAQPKLQSKAPTASDRIEPQGATNAGGGKEF